MANETSTAAQTNDAGATTSRARTFRGSFFHTPRYGEFELLEDVLIEVDARGVIASVTHPEAPDYGKRLAASRNTGTLVELPQGYYGLPGFVDLHVHAPQWPQAGIALDEPLDVWLQTRTFPLEARFADLDFARRVYTDLVSHLLSLGTTTCTYFSSNHLASSIELARICAEQGQRAIVGKVVMDDPAANPDFYRDASTAQALADTETFISEIALLAPDAPQGVYPAVTPRFIPSCTDEGLAGLGRIAERHDAYVQSHCNEGQWEHDFVMARFGKSDAEALYDFGLLREKAVMAHCTFLTEADGELFAKTGAAVAHCPISNSYFANSTAPIRRLRAQGVYVGLGTDISGGFSPSLYDNIRHAVMVSRMLEDGVDASVPQEQRGLGQPARISSVEALWLATAGGGQALHLPVGTFEVGQAFDAQVIDTQLPGADLTGFDVFSAPRDVLDRILYLATPENIRQVWAQGRLVSKRA
ncbi:MAG: guanine deaminase [Coriobacteriia bacterium]|nr:guanine deaminase [Coriobacteriia bacterium]MBS5478768.1 guanine deaminase [Coriobacteriia bacterium]